MDKVDLLEIAKTIDKPWSPVEITHVEDYVVRMAIFEGKYKDKPHKHDNYDEFFLVVKGSIQLEIEEGIHYLGVNQGLMVPKGVYHQPYAEKPAVVLMFEHKDL